MDTIVSLPAVFFAALAGFVLGAVWYGPLFGKPWMAMMGFTKDSMKNMSMKPAVAMALGFVAFLLMSYVLAHVLMFASAYDTGTSGVVSGLTGGFWCWLGFVLPVTAGVVLWEGKTWKLWVLNAGYYLVALLLMGSILATF